MPRRIDVELTSDRGDGTWTWRVAGARQPRGTLDGSLLFRGAKVGDVVRAEADFDLDGISVLAVLPPKETRPEEDRLEMLAPARDEPLVQANLVGARRRRDRPEGRDRRPPRDRPGRDRDRARDEGAGAGPRRQARRPRPETAGERSGPQNEGEDTKRRRRERPRRSEGADRRTTGPPRTAPARATAEPSRPKPKRLRPGRTHRKAVLDALPPEQQPVAEQVLQGGIPAVRQAIDKQNAAAVSEGKPEIKAAPLIALAEELLPKLRTAEWRDRAEAALADVDELDLRDLRTVVVASEAAARDDETRELAAELRAALARRVDEEQRTWIQDVTAALDEGRVVRALRLSSRPPKAGSIFPRDVAVRLAEAAGASLTADANADRWTAVLDAVALSPVRRAVTPQSRPETPDAELLATVKRLAERLPDIAAAFGVEPEPQPARRPRRRPTGPRDPAARVEPPEPAASPAPTAPSESSESPEPAEPPEPSAPIESPEPTGTEEPTTTPTEPAEPPA
jgi:hypothetical protein